MKYKLEICSAVILSVAFLASYPVIHTNKTKVSHGQVASARAKNCLLLGPDERIQEGYNYADRLDPSQKWVRNGQPTIEGNLLQGMKSICDLSGNTAEVGTGGFAQNSRSMSSDDMRKEIKQRFPNGEVPFSSMATQSKLFIPDFKKREEDAKKSKEQLSTKIKF